MRIRCFRNPKVFICLSLLGLAANLAGTTAWAHSFAAEEQLYLPADQVITDSWYAAGQNVRIDGRIQRDALVAGSQLNFDGRVDQDFMLAAERGNIGGTVAGDLRAVGDALAVSAKVGQGAVIFARELRLGPGTVIGEGLVAGAQKLTVGGVVHGRTELFGDTVQLEGVLDGDVTVHCRSLLVGHSVRVVGTLTYYADTQLQMAPGAQVGQVTWISGHQATGTKNWHGGAAGKSTMNYFFKTLFAVTFLLIGLLLVGTLPGPTQRYADAIAAKFWPSLGWGFLILFGVPLVCILFVITLLGIPLAIILGVLYLVGLFLGKLGAAYCLGRIIFRRQPQMHPIAVFLIGYALLAGVGFIPYLGTLIGWLAMIVGMGALTTFVGAPASPAAVPAPPVPVIPTPASAPVLPTPLATPPQPPAPTVRVIAKRSKTAPQRGKRVVKKTVRRAAPRKRSGR